MLKCSLWRLQLAHEQSMPAEPIVLEGGAASTVGLIFVLVIPITIASISFAICFYFSTVQPCADDPSKPKRQKIT